MSSRHYRAHSQSKLRRDRNGAIAILVAILLMTIFLFVGFSVDLSYMMLVRTELRAVADLAAKAAAGELSRTQDLNLAKAAAQEVAINHQVAAKELTLADEDIVFGHSNKLGNGTWKFTAGANPLNSVRVNARRVDGSADGSVALFFGNLYNRTDFETQVSATASFVDVDICLVLDRSSSMKLKVSSTAGGMSTSDNRFCKKPKNDSRWIALDGAVQLFVDHLEATQAVEHVALVTFASNYTSPCPETNLVATLDEDLAGDLSLVTDAITVRSKTVWNGRTDIAAGIVLGHNVLTSPSARTYAAKVMIVLTDGVYTEAYPVPAAIAAAGDDIFIHTITFSNGANQADMQAVAQAGNGNHFHAPNAAALEDVFEQIAATITILTQ